MRKSVSKQDPIFKLARRRVHATLKVIPLASSDNLSAEHVHEARVCIKKLRALLQLYRPCRSRAALKYVDRLIKYVANYYSLQRDADVQYQTLRRIGEQMGPQYEHVLQPLLNYFSRARQRTIASNPIDLPLRFECILLVWKERLKIEPVPDIELGIECSYKKARKLAHRAQLGDDDDSYHRCRKWLKYYLYQLQLVRENNSDKDRKYLKRLAELGELLGEFHDHCVLEQSLNNLLVVAVTKSAAGAESRDMQEAILLLLPWLERQKQRDKKKTRKLFARVFDCHKQPVKR